MILPNKYLELDKSLFGVGSILLAVINSRGKRTVQAVWPRFQRKYQKISSNEASFDLFIYAFIFLYSIGAIDCTEEGEIFVKN